MHVMLFIDWLNKTIATRTLVTLANRRLNLQLCTLQNSEKINLENETLSNTLMII